VLAAEHLLGFRGVDLRFERIDRPLEVRADILAALRPFEQHAEVVGLLRQAVAELAVLRQAALPLQGLLRFGLVVPEIRRGDFSFELR
jgi:hypothetical protein